MLVSNNQEFIDVSWFGTVGIVLVQDKLTLDYRGYIKDIHKSNGPLNKEPNLTVEQNDILNIMAYGTSFPREALEIIFNYIVFDDTKRWIENNPELAL